MTPPDFVDAMEGLKKAANLEVKPYEDNTMGIRDFVCDGQNRTARLYFRDKIDEPFCVIELDPPAPPVPAGSAGGRR